MDRSNVRIRITEQGEVIADRYGRPAIAARHLEQILHAVLLTSFPAERADRPGLGVGGRAPGRRAPAGIIATWSTRRRSFMTYFEQATPFAEISQLKIASRPAFRRRRPHDRRSPGDSLGLQLDAKPAHAARLVRPGERGAAIS